MKFDLPRKEHPNLEKYERHDVDTAYRFANEIYKEMGALIRAVVIFGSTARKKTTAKSDIDVLVVIDDLTISLTPEVVEAYRVIVNKSIVQVSTRLHITTLRFTSFWEYIRNGDPIGINILRDGVALIDSGFFEPLQALLKKGKIRPTSESIWTYYVRAPNTLHNSKWHLLQATLDLYWAVIDAAHAALMKHGEVPPTPEHVADLLEEKLVRKNLLEHKYVMIMRNFYKLMKMITHQEIDQIKGEEYDRYFEAADDFVKKMREFIEK
ncbi:nucleotidyltransferase domain-containing protein [Candidatus Woesearchaeota archaeon]|nr:nucleotidyltransferase domain-containing protein [Candidatus Woesearchaeota archaeon]